MDCPCESIDSQVVMGLQPMTDTTKQQYKYSQQHYNPKIAAFDKIMSVLATTSH